MHGPAVGPDARRLHFVRLHVQPVADDQGAENRLVLRAGLLHLVHGVAYLPLLVRVLRFPQHPLPPGPHLLGAGRPAAVGLVHRGPVGGVVLGRAALLAGLALPGETLRFLPAARLRRRRRLPPSLARAEEGSQVQLAFPGGSDAGGRVRLRLCGRGRCRSRGRRALGLRARLHWRRLLARPLPPPLPLHPGGPGGVLNYVVPPKRLPPQDDLVGAVGVVPDCARPLLLQDTDVVLLALALGVAGRAGAPSVRLVLRRDQEAVAAEDLPELLQVGSREVVVFLEAEAFVKAQI
mmetsp:Transcript_101251/g.287083  ORF Transcript_101251/g.287083 Transcript_101251/m.287083 type:complete len:293 (+) Transcript_101251:1022-1900(+)